MPRLNDDTFVEKNSIGMGNLNGFVPARDKKILSYCNGGDRYELIQGYAIT